MTKRPEKKRRVSIEYSSPPSSSSQTVVFHGDFEAALASSPYGKLEQMEGYPTKFLLVVDGRYDIPDIVEYLLSFNDEGINGE